MIIINSTAIQGGTSDNKIIILDHNVNDNYFDIVMDVILVIKLTITITTKIYYQ